MLFVALCVLAFAADFATPASYEVRNRNIIVKTTEVYNVTKAWNTAFRARLKFKLNYPISRGWKLRFQFMGPIARFECWIGEIKNVLKLKESSAFTITNTSYNGNLKKGQVFDFEFIAHYPLGAVDPKPPSVIVNFQNALVYKSANLRIPTNAKVTPRPDVSRTTTDLVYVLNKVFSARRSQINQQSTQSTNLISNLLDQGFSPVDPADEEDSGRPLNLNEIINQRNAEINRINDELNQLNKTSPATALNTTSIVNSSRENSTGASTNSYLSTAALNISTTTTPTSPPMTLPNVTSKYDYKLIIHKSLLFYEAQRSGKLPTSKRLEWTESSALGDKGRRGEDLSGGYYDAGDYIKFGFPMACSVTLLAWGVIEYWDVYEQSGELQYALDALRWGADYFIKAHVSRYELYGQVGNPVEEHKTWGRPDTIPNNRPAYSINKKKPGSDLAAETAAALAAVSLAMRRAANGETTFYVSELIRHADELFVFARNFRRRYHLSIKAAEKYYPSSGFKDELVWAAAWLYRATGAKHYLEWAEGQYQNWALFIIPTHLRFSWDDKRVGIQVLLAQISTTFKSRYEGVLTSYCNMLRSSKAFKTPKGLIYMADWSPLRYAANSAFACLMAADYGLDSDVNRLFFQYQIHYMLGDSGRSYVVGFGKNFPKNIHHRASSCNPRPQQCGINNLRRPAANPIILEGALVGGPDKKDKYKDKREDFKQSEVALDHNAGFQGAVAALLNHAMFPDKNLTRSHEPWYKTHLETIASEERTTIKPGSGTGSVLLSNYLLASTLFIMYCLHW